MNTFDVIVTCEVSVSRVYRVEAKDEAHACRLARSQGQNDGYASFAIDEGNHRDSADYYVTGVTPL